MNRYAVAVLKLGRQWLIIYRGSRIGSIRELPRWKKSRVGTLQIIVVRALLTLALPVFCRKNNISTGNISTLHATDEIVETFSPVKNEERILKLHTHYEFDISSIFTILSISIPPSQVFAQKLCVKIRNITEPLPMKSLSLFSDTCKLLVQCYKMLSYTCIAEHFSDPNSPTYLSFLSQNLEVHTTALQAFLENTLLAGSDVARALLLIPDHLLTNGYWLVSRIASIQEKLLLGLHQVRNPSGVRWCKSLYRANM